MSVQSAEGIILKKYYLRETSFILVVFTKEFGKLKGVIKGVRGASSQSSGNYEIFTRCDLLFYKKKKKSMDLITRCDAAECFIPARKDIERLTYANYFIELIDTVVTDTIEDPALYDILLGSLRMLATSASAKRAARIFEMKLLDSIGLRPQLHECVICGSGTDEKVMFDISSGGIVCGKCRPRSPYVMGISMGALKFMRKIQDSGIDMLSRIKVTKDVGAETERALTGFIKYRINRPVRSLVFLEQLNKWGIAK